MTNRRRYGTQTHKANKKITVPLPCEPCMDLKFTPSYAESIMTVHKLTAAQVPGWFHQRGHSVFPK